MTIRVENVLVGCGALALATTLLSPFAFGAVALSVWVPLAWLWITLGAGTLILRLRRDRALPPGDRIEAMPKVMLALHALFALQLVPLPRDVLRLVSPGSFAAHFIPPSDAHHFAPLTASPTGTFQAWLFVAGLHGLAITLFEGTRSGRSERMRQLFLGMAAVGGVLSLEGLVQAASAQPFWLYGIFPVPGAADHERGIFGPYYNRDHYSNLIAIGASVTAGLLGRAVRSGDFESLSAFAKSRDFARNVGLLTALLLMLVAGAAAGSRGGLAAMGAGLLVGLGPALLARPRLAIATTGVFVAALFGAGIPTAFVRLADVDFEASRLLVWMDALRVFTFFPVFGCGVGAFAVAYWPYQRVVRFEYWPHAHNEYLQWVLEGGLLGVLLAAWFLRLVWINAPRLIRNHETRPALAGLVAGLVHAFVDCGFRIPANAVWTSLLLVVLVTVGVAARTPAAEVLER